METKPFSLQSPEQIAKDYGGNKQKIAQAMQMGIVDPTAGTLAGMFIDRMRSAQMMEQAPQSTIAQQVMGGLPPAPQMAPPPPSGGLGATPQAGPPMAPQQETIDVPMPSDEMPEMAAGGLAGLSVPDTMFDEPDDGGYATGGLVAFAGGGQADDPLAWMRSKITSPYGKRTSGMHQGLDFGVGAGTPIGSPAPGKVIKVAEDDVNGNFVVVRHPDGTTSSYSHLSKPTVEEGQEIGPADVIGLSGNTGRVRGAGGGHHLHFGARDAEGNRINPTDFFRSIAPQTASGKWNPQVREADTSTGMGRAISAEDSLALGKRLTGDFPREELERARRYALEVLSPEAQEEVAKMDMWEGLAAMGFRMASSSAGSLLQAIGEAATATLPELKVSKKERKEAKENAVRMLMAIEDVDRKTAIAGAELGMDIYKTGLTADQAQRALSFQERELASKITQAGLDRASAEKIAGMRQSNPTEFESAIAILSSGDPKLIQTLKDFYAIKRPQTGLQLPGDESDGGAATGPWSQYQ
jgi:murein DD-endopeptidase MepM/ murein hydrolase activator NlpD